MLIAILIFSAVLLCISIFVNEKNGKVLISGYNTMSEEKRQNFRYASYVKYYKKFHLVLGISVLIISLLIYFFIGSDWSIIGMVSYSILAYTFFLWKSKQFYITITKKQNITTYISMVCMLLLMGFLLYEFTSTLKDNVFKIGNKKIEILGDYGCTINIHSIKSITLEYELPEIDAKIEGAALENIKKGLFTTKNHENVRLLLNSTKKPIILLVTKDNQKIYYSSKEKSNIAIYKAVIQKIK
jgi:preprotein translocase subunit SecG